MSAKPNPSTDDFAAQRKKLRAQIDGLDDELLRLFNERATLALEVGRLKKKAGEKLFDAEREDSIYKRMVKNNTGPLGSEATRRLFERIIDEIRRVERVEVYEKHD
ncbi:MAG: chorismate mutase [Candidatus Zixiibacteriota bacterium]